ncbi:site-2 protease family protein [Candidatus Woesearchaeota archaeon]|nr:site-2 protease family protein [Candidatus Woesearchaeota archaeon]
MNIENIIAIIFLLSLTALVYFNRRKLDFQKILFPLIYVILWRTRYGLRFMDSFAAQFRRRPFLSYLTIILSFGIVAFFAAALLSLKAAKYSAYLIILAVMIVFIVLSVRSRAPVRYASSAIIMVGFLGMTLLSVALVMSLAETFTKPSAPPAVGLVLPIKGVSGIFYVDPFYWLISIFVLAVLHEFSHGIFARLFNIKVKSSGFGALAILAPIIPLAFVEPDEKAVAKKSRREQLTIFAAGAFSNILFALILLLAFIAFIAPFASQFVEAKGVEILSFDEKISPANSSGMKIGEVITAVDGNPIKTPEEFIAALSSRKPGDVLDIKTNASSYRIALEQHPQNQSRAYVGVSVTPNSGVKPGVQERYGALVPVSIWLFGLLFTLMQLNLGIGLFNLAPLGPIDGGRMLLTALESRFDKDTARKIWAGISMLFLLLIITLILSSFGLFR